MIIIFPFLTDIAVLIVEWHWEGLGGGGCFRSTPCHCLSWGAVLSRQCSGFWCLRAGDVETFSELPMEAQTLGIRAPSAQTHVEIPGNQFNNL